jgi:outer membrane protein
MKNLSLMLNVFLLIAVIVLYVLFFTGKKVQRTFVKSSAIETNETIAEGGIVYINIDSVLSKYNMYADIQNELQEKVKTSEAQLASKENAYRKAYEDFQYKVNRQLVTRTEADEIQQNLMKQEQDLYQLQNELRIKLADEEQVAQRKVLNSIMEYLESLEANKTYQFVLGTTFGGNVLYANKKLNITNDIIDGLNKSYSEKNEQVNK